MLYYIVKHDGKSVAEADTKSRHYLIKGELLTIAELSHYNVTQRQIDNIFDLIEIPKSKIFWSFGARFIMKGHEHEAKIKKSHSLD